MKLKLKHAHMRAAQAYADCSTAVRLKVGALIVKNDAVISIGFNGTPPGWDNTCEHKEYMSVDAGGWLDVDYIQKEWPFEEQATTTMPYRRFKLITRPEVNHAEANALDKLCKVGGGTDGADMFITHAPCLECAKRIFNVGIKNVFYRDDYRDRSGLDYLVTAGVGVEQIIPEN